MLGKQHGFLISCGNIIINGSYVQELLNAILLPATLVIIKIPEHSKLDSLEVRGNHLADNSARNAALRGTDSTQGSVMVQRDISLNNNLEKLAIEVQQLALEKEKQV